MGADYGITYGVGYSYRIKNKFLPAFAKIDFSIPSGENIFDDYKTKLGIQVRLAKVHNFQFSANINGVFRHYGNDYVKMSNFGSDFSGVAGYYRNKWFVAGEVGFDKAIVTHFNHTDMYRDVYPGVIDGWYEPSTGGNFYYGIQSGFTYRNYDLTVRAGKLITQDFKTEPMLPFFGQVGVNVRF